MRTDFICILENSVVQDEGLAPLLDQHVGLRNEEAPAERAAGCLKQQWPNTRAVPAGRLNAKAGNRILNSGSSPAKPLPNALQANSQVSQQFQMALQVQHEPLPFSD